MQKLNSKEDTIFRVLRLLEKNPELTQREISSNLGLSLGGVNYCLRALIDKGFVKIENFQGSGNKLGYAYCLTPQGVYEKTILTAGFLKQKMREYEALRAEIEGLEVEIAKSEAPD